MLTNTANCKGRFALEGGGARTAERSNLVQRAVLKTSQRKDMECDRWPVSPSWAPMASCTSGAGRRVVGGRWWWAIVW